MDLKEYNKSDTDDICGKATSYSGSLVPPRAKINTLACEVGGKVFKILEYPERHILYYLELLQYIQ
jgi:hypothetical protein